MIYNTNRQKEKVEDDLMELAVLGLLEIDGQILQRESKELNQNDTLFPHENRIKFLEKKLHNQERTENFQQFGQKVSRLVPKVAVFFMVLCVGASSVLMVSADARKFLYRLLISEHERYVEIKPDISVKNVFYNLEEYQEAGAKYAPTYIPKGLSLNSMDRGEGSVTAIYKTQNEESPFLLFRQDETADNINIRLDSENVDRMETVVLGDSEGIMIEKNGRTQIVWFVGKTYLKVSGKDIDLEEMLLVAKGIKKL